MQFSIDPERLRQIITEEVTKFYVDETFLSEQDGNLEQELEQGQERQHGLERELELEKELEKERNRRLASKQESTQRRRPLFRHKNGRKKALK